MKNFWSGLKGWFKPIKWARNVVFVGFLALDFKHTYEFVQAMSVAPQAQEPVVLFGQWFPGVTNGVFDALAYAAIVTLTIYFMSNTLAHRLAKGQRSLSFWIAMVVGTLLSFLTNAGTMFLASTGTSFIPSWLIGTTAALMGGVVTFGLLMFASMDAVDMKAKIELRRKVREDKLAQLTAAQRRAKYTPKKFLPSLREA